MAIAGAGRVGTAFGRLLSDRGIPVTAVWSRNDAKARSAAAFISPSTRAASLAELPRHAALVLIAVPDDAVGSVAQQLAENCGGLETALHTSGVLDGRVLEPLAERGVACGSIHPLQTVPSPERGVELLPRSLFAVEGPDAAVARAEQLVQLLNGRILRLRPESKPLYHAAATLSGNGVTALVWAAEQMLARCGISGAEARSLVRPLMEASLRNALSLGPAAALTGPVARGDRGTVTKHWAALAECAVELRGLYRAIAAALHSVRGIPDLEGEAEDWVAALLKNSGRQP